MINTLNVTRNQNKQNLVTINYDENFGPIEQVLDGKEYERCKTGCSIIIPNNEAVTLEAYIWEGKGSCRLGPYGIRRRHQV